MKDELCNCCRDGTDDDPCHESMDFSSIRRAKCAYCDEWCSCLGCLEVKDRFHSDCEKALKGLHSRVFTKECLEGERQFES